MMEFPMVNTLLHEWNRSVASKWANVYYFDYTENGITRRLVISKDSNTSRCYLWDYYLINRFNIKKHSHVDIMKEALDNLMNAVEDIKNKGLEER